MPSFTTRVELHRATNDDYDTLHEAMEGEGFSRTISTSDGATYHLPTAEYNRSGNLTGNQVLTSAQRAAKKTGRKAAILVTESAGRCWSDLDRV
jgi:hypothetical protein